MNRIKAGHQQERGRAWSTSLRRGPGGQPRQTAARPGTVPETSGRGCNSGGASYANPASWAMASCICISDEFPACLTSAARKMMPTRTARLAPRFSQLPTLSDVTALTPLSILQPSVGLKGPVFPKSDRRMRVPGGSLRLGRFLKPAITGNKVGAPRGMKPKCGQPKGPLLADGGRSMLCRPTAARGPGGRDRLRRFSRAVSTSTVHAIDTNRGWSGDTTSCRSGVMRSCRNRPGFLHNALRRGHDRPISARRRESASVGDEQVEELGGQR